MKNNIKQHPIYKEIERWVDWYNDPAPFETKYNNWVGEDAVKFEQYFDRKPPVWFAKILSDNYHNERLYRFLRELESQIGIYIPQRSRDDMDEMGLLVVPEFVNTIIKLHEEQLTAARVIIPNVSAALTKSTRPSDIVEIAETLGVITKYTDKRSDIVAIVNKNKGLEKC